MGGGGKGVVYDRWGPCPRDAALFETLLPWLPAWRAWNEMARAQAPSRVRGGLGKQNLSEATRRLPANIQKNLAVIPKGAWETKAPPQSIIPTAIANAGRDGQASASVQLPNSDRADFCSRSLLMTPFL